MLSSLFIFPLLLTLVNGCPCTYNDQLGEVSCDPDTQSLLPWFLPECLSHIDNDQVQRLILQEQNFPQLVTGAFLIFRNLRYLDLSYSNIAVIDQYVFDENKKLDTIIMSGNDLENIPPLFESSDNSLESITMRHNKIASINSQNLHNLVYLDLDDNLMTEGEMTLTLANLQDLYHLSLESNSITSIDKNMFSSQTNLQFVSLWNNDIGQIQPGSFDQLTTLQYLNLRSNDDLEEYRTEAWHFCHSLKKESLTVELEYNKKISQDLKIDEHTDVFCDNNMDNNDGPTVETSCTDDEGHLTCSGDVEDLICELRTTNFTSITFTFPKDSSLVNVDNFYEAESNAYFTEINGKSNLTKYVADLKLYGTKFDLATLDDYVGYRTETVTIFADTIFMSQPLPAPIKSRVFLRARVVSISDDIPMNMTRNQFFQHLEADQPVDNWASVDEVVTGVGKASFSVRKLGFIEVQQARNVIPKLSESEKMCSPRYFDVHEYELEHHTPPSVFFDRVQLNLLRMSVRTLASTRSNDILALDMADHSLMKTTDPSIVEDKKAYIVAQKLIRDKDIMKSHNRNVPFYTTRTMKDLAKIMFDRMTLYAANETILMLKLDIALGRMADMNKNFEDARLNRELYFQEELNTLEQIWESTNMQWEWTFNASRSMEESIQDSIQKNGEAMFEMQENELQEMLAEAEATVVHDRAVVEKFKEEIDRYTEEAKMSAKLQKQKLDETNTAGDRVDTEKEKLDAEIEKWKQQQLAKAFFGFFKALVGFAIGIAFGQPEFAAGAVAGAAAEAGEALDIGEIFAGIVEVVEALKGIEDVLETIDFDVDFDIDGDIALGVANNWRDALVNAYDLKNMTSKFSDIRIAGETQIASVKDATGGDVDPTDMQQAMYTYADRGTQLIQETVNFAELMMKLADLAGELEVAELDLELAIEQVDRIEQMLLDLAAQHDEYVDWMNQHRDDYQNKCDEMAEAWEENLEAAKAKYKDEIMELFNRFKEAFEESNKQYIGMMNNLTAALYTKVANVKQHSMVQRSMIMNLYQDYCDGLFYYSFTDCFGNKEIPTMSDEFDTLLSKLSDIQWDSITSMDSWEGNLPEGFDNVFIDLLDHYVDGYDNVTYGAATSLRENGQVDFNFRMHDDFLKDFWRVRVNAIRVHLLDKNYPPQLYQTPENEIIVFTVVTPLEFYDSDVHHNVYSFRGMDRSCTAAYYLQEGEIIPISGCEVSEEFNGVNHKTSHDGLFKVEAIDIRQEILDKIGGIRVTLDGSYVTHGKKNDSNLLC